jgi:DNA-binding XRE family transcriptional regulator
MSDLSFKSISELQALLGEQVQALRLSKDLDQITTAEKAGISEKALRNLEAGAYYGRCGPVIPLDVGH